LDSAVAS